MPELPEVETIRKGLAKKVIGKKITALTVFLPKIVRRHVSTEEVVSKVRGKIVIALQRRGKSLLFMLNSSDVLVFRLGMTGQMLWSHSATPVARDKHTHLIVDFGKGERIFFKDIRQFGEVFLTRKGNVETILNMGVEPLGRGFTYKVLKEITSSPMRIKPLLMDQKRIAGIGNIYADEILFEAGINPLRPACSLDGKVLKSLHRSIGLILNEAIACKGDTIGNYRNAFGESGGYQNFHRVYQREGEPCLKCNTPITRVKLSGRSCHFCVRCQT